MSRAKGPSGTLAGGYEVVRGAQLDFSGTSRFEVKRRLGAGGMGVVYEAFDRERKQAVALKTLKRFDAQALFRFKNEFRALHDMDHPNLVSLYELCEEDGECFFTMELVRGTDLLSYVSGIAADLATDESSAQTAASGLTTPQAGIVTPSNDTLRAERVELRSNPPRSRAYDEPRLRASFKQLAQGVAALHAAGKVHRDIKPSNILVTEQGRVVLLDFGLVTAATKDGQSTQASVVGTAEYMAPEQAMSGDVGPAADWYAVGVVLYEGLTNALPHSGRTPIDLLIAKQQHTPPPPRARQPSVPADLDELCVALLEREPKNRPSQLRILDWLGVDRDTANINLRTSTVTGFTQTTPFIGRERELGELRAAFDSPRTAPAVVIVESESGFGKSELVGEFSKRVLSEVPDAVVLAGRCYERESVAYKAFDGIVDALSRYMTRLPNLEATALLPRRAGLLPRLFPVLQRVEAIAAAPREAEVADPQEMRRQMFSALRELLARLADRHPVVLAIDDLQWTDVDSMTLLQELLSDAAAPNLLVVATMRPVDDLVRERIFSSFSTLQQTHIKLAAFPFARAKELAGVLLPSFDDRALSAIAQEAAGHPLFVMELARYAQDQGHRRGQDSNHRVTLDETLWHRISLLPFGLRGLLEIVCVAGAPLPQKTTANAAGVRHEDLAKAVSSLRIAYLVRTGGVREDALIEPYHDRIREIVTTHLRDDERKHCHRRLAIALEQAGAAQNAPQALVRHAEAAGDTARAAEYAEAAAHHAVTAMAFDKAADFLKTALRLGSYDEDRTRALCFALADAFVNAGRGPEAAEAFMGAAEGAEVSTRLDCQRRAAEQWLISGHIDRGLDAMAELLAQSGIRTPTTPKRALASLLWSRVRLRLGGLRWSDTPKSEIPRGELMRIDVHKAVSYGLGLVDTIRGHDFHSRGLLLALRTGERRRVARGIFYEVIAVASQGGRSNLRRSEELAGIARQIDPGDPYLRAWKFLAEGSLDYFRSRLRSASEKFAEAEHGFREQPGAIWELSNVRLFRLWSLSRMGALGEMAPLVHEYVRDATRRGDLYTQTSLIRSCHIVWLAKHDLDRARRQLERTAWAPGEGRYHLQHWFAFRAEREMDLYQGCACDAWESAVRTLASLKNSMLLRIITLRIDARWLCGRLAVMQAASSDQPAKALNGARKMARLLEREQDTYATVSAYLLRAAIATQEGKTELALTILAPAADAAEQADMFLHAASARLRQGQLIGGDEGEQLIGRAKDWMASEEIRSAASMGEIFAPGFRHES